MEQTKTKKALIMSVLSVFLCIAMLIGMTFAWFTDTASTGVNKIQSGNLKIALYYADNATGGEGTNWTKLDNNSPALGFLQKQSDGTIKQSTDILWEPGCTYSLPALKVVNEGNLALKYKVQITGIKGDAKLNEVIDWTISDTSLDVDHSLAAGATSEPLTIKGHMQETAGNEYQGLSIDGIAITVYATQLNNESDSYGPDYDIDAMYPIEAVSSVETKTNDGITSVAKGVVIKTVATVKVSDTETKPVATATVAADTKLENNSTTKLKLVIKDTDEPNGFTVETGKKASTFDVSVIGVATDNTTPITVDLYVGTSLENVKLYHKGAAMDASTYSYNAATGFITFKTATFSPFTVTYTLPPATAGGIAYDTLEKAIANANGEKIVLNEDVKTSKEYKFSGNINIDLNGHTWELGNNTGINDACNLTVSNGKILGKGSSSYIDIRVGANKKATVKFTDVDFENEYKLGSKAGGSSTTYTDYILKYSPNNGSENLDITFKDCKFKNAAVQMNGYSNAGEISGTFDNCKFDALTNTALFAGNSYTTGTITVKGCSFNVIVTTNVKVLDGGKVKVTAEGTNTFDGRVATDADRAKGSEYAIELYKTQSAKAGISGDGIILKGLFAK